MGTTNEAGRVMDQLQAWRDGARDKLRDLSEGLRTEDPLRALEWAQDAFDWAARYRVASLAERALDAHGSLRKLHQTAISRTIRGARHPERSTSATGRLAAEAETVAWAELVELLED